MRGRVSDLCRRQAEERVESGSSGKAVNRSLKSLNHLSVVVRRVL
jgi:hypothetical protein